MFINKDIYNIIESYTQFNNLYNFFYNDEILEIICDKCDKCFSNCLNRNKIKYKLEKFNNNLIHFLNFSFLDFNELQILSKINYLEVEYTECNYIFCPICILNIEKIEKHHKLDTFGLNDFEYISEKYTNLIKFNNFYFHNDLIETYNVTIDRRKYFLKDNELSMQLIKFSHYDYNKLQDLRPENLIRLKELLVDKFQINLNYINDYIKIKYQ